VAAFVAVACVGPDPVPAAATAPTPARTETIRLLAQASVLVTGEPGDVRTIDALSVEPVQIVLDAGSSAPLTATAFDGAGLEFDDVTLIWSISDPRAGKIGSDGRLVAGSAPGTYRDAVTVTAVRNSAAGIQSVASSVDVTVVGEPSVRKLASVSVFPDRTTVSKNEVYRMRAAAFDEDGQLIPQVNILWSVDVPALGRINQLGYLTVLGDQGNYERSVTVTAVWEGETITRTVDVFVTELAGSDDFLAVQALPETFRLHAGEQLQLAAIALDALGQIVRTTQIKWSVVDPKAGSIDGDGLFTAAQDIGIFTEAVVVEAVSLGASGEILSASDFASVVVLGEEAIRPLAAIRVVPSTLVAPNGSRLVMIVQGIDESGTPAPNTMFVWESLDRAVGEIDEAGSLHLTGEPGIYTRALKVTATQGTGSDSTSLTRFVDVVITGRLSQVTIEPELATVVPGRTIHFAISSRDAQGNDLSGLTVLWRVTDPAAGTIDPFGNFTAGVAEGLYQNSIVAEVIQSVLLPD
jgi:hypothetical protein